MSEHQANPILAETPPTPSWAQPSRCKRPQHLTVLARLLLWLTH